MEDVGIPTILSTEEPNDFLQKYASMNTSYGITQKYRKYDENISNGTITINEQLWYFKLVRSTENKNSRRSLMDNYSINDINDHLVVCYTPNFYPGTEELWRTDQGKPIHLFTFFDSYVEYYQYIQNIERLDRSFYEIIFGELPQKPHFDIDIDRDKFVELYPNEDIDIKGWFIIESLIEACMYVCNLLHFPLDIQRDILIYTSHGVNKRSYHLVITNKCHDGNDEAKAFYLEVMRNVAVLTSGKYLDFIDHAVYSPKQQFRILGATKMGADRPKVFHKYFTYKGVEYEHILREDSTNENVIKLNYLYESLVSFTAGCVFLPSLIQNKPKNFLDLSNCPDMSEDKIRLCLSLMKVKLKACPFDIKEVKGHLIVLKRNAASYCPNCERDHENENPMIYIINSSIYWNCRRSDKSLLLGYFDNTTVNIPENTSSTVIHYLEPEQDTSMYLGDVLLHSNEQSYPNKAAKISEEMSVTINVPSTSTVPTSTLVLPGHTVMINGEHVVLEAPKSSYNPMNEILKIQRERSTSKQEVAVRTSYSGRLSLSNSDSSEISFEAENAKFNKGYGRLSRKHATSYQLSDLTYKT